MIIIRVIDTTKIESRDDDTIHDMVVFESEIKRWHARLGEAAWDKDMKKAWLANHTGLSSQSTTRGAGHYFFYVYETRTRVRYLLGKLTLRKNKKGGLIDLSEVISNPVVEQDKRSLDEDTSEFMIYLAQRARERGENVAGTWGPGIDLDKVNKTAQPLGCLFAWASTQASTFTLTANTVGLVHLYRSYGFEIDGGVNPMVKRYLETPKESGSYAEVKWAQIDLPMRFNPEKHEALLGRFVILRDWVGPTL